MKTKNILCSHYTQKMFAVVMIENDSILCLHIGYRRFQQHYFPQSSIFNSTAVSILTQNPSFPSRTQLCHQLMETQTSVKVLRISKFALNCRLRYFLGAHAEFQQGFGWGYIEYTLFCPDLASLILLNSNSLSNRLNIHYIP